MSFVAPATAQEKMSKAISMKITGVMRGSSDLSATSCFLRLRFQNHSIFDTLIPFEYSFPRWPKKDEPYVLQSEKTDHFANTAICATATCKWSTTSDKKVVTSVAKILGGDINAKPGQDGVIIVEVPRPPKGLYKLHVHFDNKMLFEPTKGLADFTGCHPQFFEADDEIQVIVK